MSARTESMSSPVVEDAFGQPVLRAETFRPKILLYRGTGFISASIRWQTRGDYAHAAIWAGPDEVIEAMQFAGVRSRQYGMDDIKHADVYEVPSCSDEQWKIVVDFARSQIGDRYDYLSILRFITRWKGVSDNTWFCSELVFAALQAADVWPLDRINANAVSPELLSVSPLLVKQSTSPHMMGASLKHCGDIRAALYRADMDPSPSHRSRP